MENISSDSKLVAFCGLYCGSCKAYNNKKCPGCKENEKASWCKVRACCMYKNILSCADCKEFDNHRDCKKLNNFISKIFSLLFKSDRFACLQSIKDNGYENFAKYMAENKLQSIKRK